MDNLTTKKRSKIMRSIKSKNTKPEIEVRKILTNLGYRYRLNYKKLPGKPDIVFIGKRKVIFIHGCFWHHHSCQLSRIPAGEFWQNKIKRNIDRDTRVYLDLETLGWSTLTIWECDLKNPEKVLNNLQTFLEGKDQVG